ncbi:MAG TPA: PLDc N-terminal domain-containing protein [Pyrinomonadaceae bacterium]|nr:PLDc N-terminal domain-containing protein [Pyrinomonadaceae bacterium]
MNFGDFTTAFYVFMGIGLFAFCIQILALIDVVRSEFRGQNDKIIWVLVVLFLGIF